MEENQKTCTQCGAVVMHESSMGSPPEAEYYDGDPYCPDYWDWKKNKPFDI